MKEQYVGDVNDYWKYAVLRALLGGTSLKLGIAWMLTPPDASRDGQKLSYLDNAAFRSFDTELFDHLSEIVSGQDQRLSLVERRIFPGAICHGSLVPDSLVERRAYFRSLTTNLAAADLIFLDPDNGLDVPSKGKGSAGSSRYVYRDEIEDIFGRGHSALIYQHFPRVSRDLFTARLGEELKTLCPTSAVWAFRTANVVFLLVVHPRHAAELDQRAESAALKWPHRLMSVRRLS